MLEYHIKNSVSNRVSILYEVHEKTMSIHITFRGFEFILIPNENYQKYTLYITFI